jgi:hypothetical protein
MELLAGGVVLLLSRASLDMPAQRSTVFVELLIEQARRRTLAVFVVGIDVADELAAEEKEVVQVATNGRAGKLVVDDKVGDEGLELLE